MEERETERAEKQRTDPDPNGTRRWTARHDETADARRPRLFPLFWEGSVESQARTYHALPHRFLTETDPHRDPLLVPSDMVSTTPKNLLVLLAGALVLLVLLWDRGKKPATALPAATLASADRELFEGLARELRALRVAHESTSASIASLGSMLVERGAPTSPSDRRLAGAPATDQHLPPADFAELIASLDALRHSLATEAQKTQALIRTAPAFGGETLNQVRKRRSEIDWHSLESLRAKWEHDADEANRTQYLQSAKDLVEAYGPPSAIYRPKDGLLFTYRGPEEEGRTRTWYFRLKDGFVIEFFVEWEELEEESG